eukprot:992035-Pleurochrysis_carterae.AAC.1
MAPHTRSLRKKAQQQKQQHVLPTEKPDLTIGKNSRSGNTRATIDRSAPSPAAAALATSLPRRVDALAEKKIGRRAVEFQGVLAQLDVLLEL